MVNNKNLTEIEYYMIKKDRTDWTQAEYDIRDGILRICDVPFEYRSLSLYRKGYRKCFIDCFEISRPREIAKEAAPLEKQILEDIAECEARYQRSGNLSKEYPWYLLKARMYCLKRLYQEGVIDGLFKKRDTASCVADVFSQDKLSNDSLASFEKKYNIRKSNDDYDRASDDLLYGKTKIYEIPFEYRSNIFYIMSCRFATGRIPRKVKAEKNLLKTIVLDDIEECVRRFWKNGNLPEAYRWSKLKNRELMLKKFYIECAAWGFLDYK